MTVWAVEPALHHPGGMKRDVCAISVKTPSLRAFHTSGVMRDLAQPQNIADMLRTGRSEMG
jgi:hypothetical protein